MDHKEFGDFRFKLQKTQQQLSEILGTSLKAVQSFEQGWRRVPVHIERQVLFLVTLQKEGAKDAQPCWDIQNCPEQTRRNCPAWEFNAGNLCWFINGTICHGKPQTNWSSKMKVCRKCQVFRSGVGPLAMRKKSTDPVK